MRSAKALVQVELHIIVPQLAEFYPSQECIQVCAICTEQGTSFVSHVAYLKHLRVK